MSIEAQFAHVLQDFQTQRVNPFEIVSQFKSIAAQRAIEVAEKLGTTQEADAKLMEEFENWDLETKLWNLVEILASFRTSVEPELLPEHPFSSLSTKQENWLRSNPKIRELTLIISWLQANSSSDDIEIDEDVQGKWTKTKSAIKNKDIGILAGRASNDDDLVQYLDADAPLRSNKKIHPDDESTDTKNFSIIYNLLLANKIQEAVEHANNTGNFTLGLIISGSTQDYYDPVIDKDHMEVDEQPLASGLKHKSMWKKTVYKLSQQTSLNRYERLIYSFLSGGDITLNLEESRGSWEDSLLLYLTQLYEYEFEQFIGTKLNETLPISIPKPQVSSISEVLNILSKSGSKIASSASHPLRIIQGGVMINQVSELLHNIIQSLDEEVEIKPYLVRVVTHLSILQLFIDSAGQNEPVNSPDLTTIITLYISKLSDYKLTELIPIYITIIPDEKDARETYALFLSSITDVKERQKQLEISKKLAHPLMVDENDLLVVDDTKENKMVNVLRRTVERTMKKSEDHYKTSTSVTIQDDMDKIDDVDSELYHSVEWFYENDMYEDSITATLTIIRRFLLSGRLATLQKFSQGKSFKKLIRNYDIEVHTKSITNQDYRGAISDSNKQELLQYEEFVAGLNLIHDWKKFLGTQDDLTHKYSHAWESKEVENTIDTIIETLNKLIANWFNGLLSSSDVSSQDKQVFKELRTIYVPYLIIELLQIFKIARFKDWSFIKGAYNIINDLANETENDYLKCFNDCGRLPEFLVISGEIFVIASEKQYQ